MQWQKVISEKDSQKKAQHIVRLGTHKICLWFQNQTWFAFDLRCPHEGYPLSQGDVDGNCVLTCRWHNWRFRLTDGKTLQGEDRLQTYPVKIENGALWVDLQQPSPEERRHQLLKDLKPLFERRYYGAIGRLLSKWHAYGLPFADLHTHLLNWRIDRLERGFSHSVTAIGEWMTLSKRFSNDAQQIACHLEAIDFLAEDCFGEPTFPYASGSQTFDPEGLIQALEKEDEDTAVRMIQFHLEQQLPFETLEACLVKFVFSHYIGFGHAVIYLTKLTHLFEVLGPKAKAPLLKSYVRYLCQAIREDLLPDFKQYQTILNQIEPPKPTVLVSQAPELPPLGSSLSQIWSWLDDACKSHHHQAIHLALTHAAARNLLYFDEDIQHRTDLKPRENFSWLSISHGITFAEASTKLLARYPQFMPVVLVQLAAFIGRVSPAINPKVNPQPWQTNLHALQQWVPEQILQAGETENIYPVHWLKTFLAAESLTAHLPLPAQDTLWAAINRYLKAPIFKKSPVRTIRQAQSLLQPEKVLSA